MNDNLLYDIAAHAGVQRGFRDARGQHVDSPPHAIAAILTALGHDVASDAARERTLAELQATAKSPAGGDQRRPEADAPARIALDGLGEIGWRLTLEDGSVREGHAHDAVTLDPLPAGYHRLHIDGQQTDAWILAAPKAGFLPEALRDGGRGFGVTAQVYGLRSSSNFGMGDLSDVGDLAEGAGRFGATFLGLSPLHALFPTDRTKISPYSPSSRLFVDPMFIDPTVLPDFPASTAARFMTIRPTARPSSIACARRRSSSTPPRGRSNGISSAATGRASATPPTPTSSPTAPSSARRSSCTRRSRR